MTASVLLEEHFSKIKKMQTLFSIKVRVRADPFQSRSLANRSAPLGSLGAVRSRARPTALMRGRPPARAENLVRDPKLPRI